MKINKMISSLFGAMALITATSFMASNLAVAADLKDGATKTFKVKKNKKQQNKDVNAEGVEGAVDANLPTQFIYSSIVVNTIDANQEEIHYLTGGYRPFVDYMKEQGVTVRLLPVRDVGIYKEDINSANSSTKFIFCELEKCAYAFMKGYTPIMKRNDNSRITFLSMSSSGVKKETDLKGAKIAFFGDSVTYFLLEEAAKQLFADEFKKNPNLKVTELFSIDDMSHLSKVQLAEYLHDGKFDAIVAPSADMVEITGNHPAAYRKVYVSEPLPSALLLAKLDSLDSSTVEKLKDALTKLRTEKDRAKWMGVPEDRGFGGEVFGPLTNNEEQALAKFVKIAPEVDAGNYIKKSSASAISAESTKTEKVAPVKKTTEGVSEGSSASVVFKKKDAPVEVKKEIKKPVVVPVVKKVEPVKAVVAPVKPIKPATATATPSTPIVEKK